MEETKFHPHLIPVVIRHPEDLAMLGQEMRRDATYDPVMVKPEYNDLDTVAKITENKDAHFEDYMQNSRFAVLNGHICSFVMTMDKYEGKSNYHLSMVEQLRDPTSENGIKHVRIPNSIAPLLAKILLGGECQEMSHEGLVFLDVRDFVREAE